jgi:hypothetical protein
MKENYIFDIRQITKQKRFLREVCGRFLSGTFRQFSWDMPGTLSQIM